MVSSLLNLGYKSAHWIHMVLALLARTVSLTSCMAAALGVESGSVRLKLTMRLQLPQD